MRNHLKIAATTLTACAALLAVEGCNKPNSDQSSTAPASTYNSATSSAPSVTDAMSSSGPASSSAMNSTPGSTANSASVDNSIDDSVITGKVKAALLGDSQIKSFDISVATHNGEVQLSGNVNNNGQVERSVQVARGVEGVKSVVNHLMIKQ